MGIKTQNLNLEKPFQTDVFDVDVFLNGNMDILDAAVGETQTAAGKGYWKKGETVQEGYVRYPTNVSANNIRLVCKKNGVTNDIAEPIWADPGTVVEDGTTEWEVQSAIGGNIGEEIAAHNTDPAAHEEKFEELKTASSIIYPNGGTAENPANISVNTRYIEDNPFPGYYVHCELQVFYDGHWGTLDFFNYSYSNYEYGVGAKAYQYLPDDNIIIQVGSNPNYILYISGVQGNPFGRTVNAVNTAIPVRIVVTRLGAIG